MKEPVSNPAAGTPMLFPYQPEQFWTFLRQVIREEVNNAKDQGSVSPSLETPGLTYKPLFKIAEICAIFQVTKPVIPANSIMTGWAGFLHHRTRSKK